MELGLEQYLEKDITEYDRSEESEDEGSNKQEEDTQNMELEQSDNHSEDEEEIQYFISEDEEKTEKQTECEIYEESYESNEESSEDEEGQPIPGITRTVILVEKDFEIEDSKNNKNYTLVQYFEYNQFILRRWRHTSFYSNKCMVYIYRKES